MRCPIEVRQSYRWIVLVTEKAEAHLYAAATPILIAGLCRSMSAEMVEAGPVHH
jgi:hypothetical protein